MSFEVKICLSETCTGVRLVDNTGFFSTTNPEGYNAPPLGTGAYPTLTTLGVFGYSEYQLQLFFAIEGGYDDTGTADFTANLLTWPHTIDTTTGYVTWNFTFEELAISSETLRSGWWLARLDPVTWDNGVDPEYDYSREIPFGFTGDLTTKIDNVMKENVRNHGTDGCDCDCGGSKLRELYQRFRIWREFTGCTGLDSAFQTEADWLYHHSTLCDC